jgi:hypothetical protein
MARTRKSPVALLGSEKAQDENVPAWVSEEAQEQEKAVAAGRVAEGTLQRVECDLPGYEDVVVYFRTNNRYEVAELFRNNWRGTTVQNMCRVLAWFIRKVEWNFLDFEGKPIPPPRGDDPETFAYPLVNMIDFLQWCRFVGYPRALEQAMGNSGSASNSPTRRKPNSENAEKS